MICRQQNISAASMQFLVKSTCVSRGHIGHFFCPFAKHPRMFAEREIGGETVGNIRTSTWPWLMVSGLPLSIVHTAPLD